MIADTPTPGTRRRRFQGSRLSTGTSAWTWKTPWKLPSSAATAWTLSTALLVPATCAAPRAGARPPEHPPHPQNAYEHTSLHQRSTSHFELTTHPRHLRHGRGTLPS